MPAGDASGIVKVLFMLVGAGVATFVIGTALPWPIAKYIFYASGGSCIVIYTLRKTLRWSSPGLSLDIKFLGGISGLVGVGQLLRWGSIEFVKTFSAGIKARQEGGY
eukprot:TRINITY_DN13941_c0_g1_i1.p1 TRINITY_DN13941_c0_g1~~TRINITY_DN13941_c0_g1_i1.p1  ORF type:complete len:107 (-),score=4.25 TRINITY_DN13941_c0_g1_i1:91-411(-)